MDKFRIHRDYTMIRNEFIGCFDTPSSSKIKITFRFKPNFSETRIKNKDFKAFKRISKTNHYVAVFLLPILVSRYKLNKKTNLMPPSFRL